MKSINFPKTIHPMYMRKQCESARNHSTPRHAPSSDDDDDDDDDDGGLDRNTKEEKGDER